MTWFIPTWYRSPLGKTPYAAFERWRLLPRIVGYAIYAPQVMVLVAAMAMAAISPEYAAEKLIYLRSADGALPSTGQLFLFQLSALAFFIAPAYLVMGLSSFMHKRRNRQLKGRCLNCGESRLSEFLDECSACGSSFVEQDIHRILARSLSVNSDARMREVQGKSKTTLRFAPMRRRVPGLGRLLRRGLYSILFTTLAITASAVWMYLTDDGRPGPREMSPPFAALILSIMSFFLPLSLLMYWSAADTVNLRRLKMRCLDCESPLTDGSRDCAECGSSILDQQLYIRAAVRQAWAVKRYRGDWPILARELGVPLAAK